MTDHLYTTLGSGWRYNHPYWDILIFTNFYAKYDCMAGGWLVRGSVLHVLPKVLVVPFIHVI